MVVGLAQAEGARVLGGRAGCPLPLLEQRTRRAAIHLPAEPAQVVAALHVPLAEVAGAVAGCLQPLRPVRMFRAEIALVVVHAVDDLQHAVGVGEQPGHQAGPRGRADRVGRVCPREPHAARRKAVEVRGQAGIAGIQHAPLHLVSHQEQDVRSVGAHLGQGSAVPRRRRADIMARGGEDATVERTPDPRQPQRRAAGTGARDRRAGAGSHPLLLSRPQPGPPAGRQAHHRRAAVGEVADAGRRHPTPPHPDE